MIGRLDDYDWKEVFAFSSSAEGHNNSPDITAVPPSGSGPSTDEFTREDIRVVVWISDGENDERDWLIGGQLKDGRWFFIAAGCDYTGWDCQSGGHAYVADSREAIERYAMGDADRERLDVSLPEDAERRMERAGW